MYCKLCDKNFSDTEVTKWEDEIYCPDCGHSIKMTNSENEKISDEDEKIIKLVRSNYENKPTSELLTIWENNNQDEYRVETFKVIKQILTERVVPLPSQKAKKSNPEKLLSIRPTYISVLSVIMIILGIIWLLSFGDMIINPAKHYITEADGTHFRIERDSNLGYLIMVFFSILMIASGYSLRKLKNWGRILTLVILIFFALFWGIKGFIAEGRNFTWALGYAVGSIIIFIHPIYYLLKPDIVKLFIKSIHDKEEKEFVCSECNTPVKLDDKICPKCGEKL